MGSHEPSQRRPRFPRAVRARLALRQRLIVAVAALSVALAIPTAAFAWQWGYNYMTPNANSTVTAGWNYWSSLYIDKRSGGRIDYTFTKQTGGYCVNLVDGVTQVATTPSAACGYGGYLYLNFHYIYGNSSYVFLQAG
jgi:hypothetical protein